MHRTLNFTIGIIVILNITVGEIIIKVVLKRTSYNGMNQQRGCREENCSAIITQHKNANYKISTLMAEQA